MEVCRRPASTGSWPASVQSGALLLAWSVRCELQDTVVRADAALTMLELTKVATTSASCRRPGRSLPWAAWAEVPSWVVRLH